MTRLIGRGEGMRSKVLVLGISGSEYVRLCDMAKAELRDPMQQARWILKQALAPEQCDVTQDEPKEVDKEP